MSFVHFSRTGKDGNIAEITLDRPEARNAFHTEMAKEILEICRQIAESDIRVVLLTSSNSKSFCSGADLKERNRLNEAEWRIQHKLFEEMYDQLADLKQPTIAVVDGFALAGGFELVLNCDFIVAARTATFGLPEVTRGIMPGGGGTRLLAKRIGLHLAKEWLCTGRFVIAEEANRAGLLNRLTKTEHLQQHALELAESIAVNAPLAVQSCKASADELSGMTAIDARRQEIIYYNRCIDTEDRIEGVKAFVEKRKPHFTGK